MGNTNSTKPERQPPPPSPVLATEESYESAKESFESAEVKEWEISNFICEICVEHMSSPNKKFTNKGLCAHPFCVDCITKYIQVKVEHDHVAEIKCPGLNCDQLLDPFTCQTFIPPQLFTKWCDVMCQQAVSGLERKCYCPNRECSEVVVNECGGNVKKSKCPNCKRLFCFSCGVKWHAGFSCEESGKMRRDRNDVAFGVLAEKKKWMRCPGCKHFVERVDGCRIVTCSLVLFPNFPPYLRCLLHHLLPSLRDVRKVLL
ncbi:hypothetical protein Vadar_030378 [Vaccinium darrowii]|uniref:Uncharacterized protein n=1 Tax=Vaccinium darrowii TaxID=229202 RepID=A0ACB7X4X3_9ERIC|nr:hypothetical protein Vadar_030378 [Vaccinium darrowii]